MTDRFIGRKALRAAERDARADASRLVAAVPALMQEAKRRRRAGRAASPTLAQLSGWALPRLAAATAVLVIAATGIVSWERSKAVAAKPTTIESVILSGDGDDTG